MPISNVFKGKVSSCHDRLRLFSIIPGSLDITLWKLQRNTAIEAIFLYIINHHFHQSPTQHQAPLKLCQPTWLSLQKAPLALPVDRPRRRNPKRPGSFGGCHNWEPQKNRWKPPFNLNLTFLHMNIPIRMHSARGLFVAWFHYSSWFEASVMLEKYPCVE